MLIKIICMLIILNNMDQVRPEYELSYADGSQPPSGTVVIFGETISICSQHQTCQGRCGNPPTNTSLCNCDSHCERYGDCCYDYWTNCTVKNIQSLSHVFWDRTICTDPGRVYLINKCSRERIDYVNLSKCEKPNPDDLLQKIPVSDSSNVAYYNVFCALCNGVSILDVVAWEITAQCRYANIMYESHLLTTMAPTTPISFRNMLSDIDRAEDCYYEYQPVGNLSKRHCSNEYGFTYCPMHADEEVTNYCKMYKAPVYGNGVVYANPHCARCHGVLDYVCRGLMPETPDFLIPEGEYIPIAILVDFSSGSVSVESPSEKVITENVDCGLGRVYNPFNDKCIETICELGKVPTEIGCIELIEFSFAVAVPVPTENPSGPTTEVLCFCKRSSIVQVRYNANNESIPEKYITQMTSLIQGYDTVFHIHHFGTSNTILLFETSECQLLNEVHTLIYQQSNSNDDRSLLKNITMTQICENENMTSPGVGSCDNQFFNINKLNVTEQREGFAVTDENNDFIISKGDYQVKIAYIIASNKTLSTLRIANCSYSKTCPLVALEIIDFHIFNNDTWVYKPTGRQYRHDEITIMFNDTVLVCSFFSQNGTRTSLVTFFVYEDTLQIINLVGVSCSLLGLFLTLIVYCAPKKRKTYPGTIVINITVSLSLAQLMTIFAGMVTSQYKHVCTAFAALLHYLWLVAFMWMFLMSLSLFKSFRSFKSSLDTQHQKHSMKCFALGFGWGIPLGFVAILLTLHLCDCVYLPFNFMYGDDTVCWIRDEISVFLFFGIPMAIILFVNSSLFIATAYGIYRSKKHSKKFLRDLKKKNIMDNLIIYAKISCIVGLTWIFGFLALFIDQPVFWYTFIILNSMQGVFIFISFTASTMIEVLMRK